MKFKIYERFLTEVKDYLQSHEIAYELILDSNQTEGIIDIKDSNQQTINMKHMIAEKLLHQFQKQKLSNNNLTITSWMEQYQKLLVNVSEFQTICCGLNLNLQINKYNDLKNKISQRKRQLSKTIEQYKMEKQIFEEQTAPEEERIKLNLQNMSYRLAIKRNNQNQPNEEFKRVQNLLKNGMWGTLVQIQAKIKQIQNAQKQIQILKNNQSN